MDSTTPEERAEKLLDEHRQKMIQCLAAAFFGDESGSVCFNFHFQDGDYRRARATSDFGLS